MEQAAFEVNHGVDIAKLAKTMEMVLCDFEALKVILGRNFPSHLLPSMLVSSDNIKKINRFLKQHRYIKEFKVSGVKDKIELINVMVQQLELQLESQTNDKRTISEICGLMNEVKNMRYCTVADFVESLRVN